MSWMTPMASALRRVPGEVERVPVGPLEALFAAALLGEALPVADQAGRVRGGGAGWPYDLPSPAARGRLVVLGAFGSGKTETSRRVGAALGVPVVPLRVLARAPDLEAARERLLAGADVAILDGLDEIGRPHEGGVPELVERATRGLRRWVLTSRPGHVRTDLSDRDPGQLDAFDLPLVEIDPYPLPAGAPACCAENPVLLALWNNGARGEDPRSLAEDHLGRTGRIEALEALAWAAFRDPGRSVEGASFAASDLAGLPAPLFVEDLDGRWRFGHRSLYDALVARRLARGLAASQGGGPDELTGLALSGAMRSFLVGSFPGWRFDDERVQVPRGNFVCGGSRSGDERPLVIRHLDRPWRLARRAVTNGEFQAFLDAKGPRPFSLDYLCHWRGERCPPALRAHPVTNLRPEDADAYAAWRGAVLPPAEVWEKAVRGWDGRNFPWGDASPGEGEGALANTARLGLETTAPVDRFPQGSGLHGAIGDSFEYTSSHYRGRWDRGRVVMGGSWAHPPLRASLRLSHTLSGRLRCGLRLAWPEEGG